MPSLAAVSNWTYEFAIWRRLDGGAEGATAFTTFSNSARVSCVLQEPAELEELLVLVAPVLAAPVRTGVFVVPVGVTSQTPFIVSTGVSGGSSDPGPSVFCELEAVLGAALWLDDVEEDWLCGFAVPGAVCPTATEALRSKVTHIKWNLLRFKTAS